MYTRFVGRRHVRPARLTGPAATLLVTLALSGCAPAPAYEDPLAQIGRTVPASTSAMFTTNTARAMDAATEVHSSTAMARFENEAAVEDADPVALTHAIDEALKARFAQVVPLKRIEDASAAGVDAVMFLDIEITYGTVPNTNTTIALRGIFTDRNRTPMGEAQASGAARIPFFPTAYMFRSASDRAVKQFAQSLDHASDVAAHLAAPSAAPVAMAAAIPAAPPGPPLALQGVAGRRVALVIGNGTYRNVPRLGNTTNDAKLIAATLQRLGFELVGGGAMLDLDHDAFLRAVASFGRQLNGANVSVFYYAGHGLQMRGENYLVPTDANPQKPSDADLQLIGTGLVLRQMEDSGAKLKVVVLDACRNNPFGGRSLRDANGGLAQMAAPVGTLISYATAPGNVAEDGGPGADSPYTTALAQEMQRPGVDVLRMFNAVAVDVDRQTGHNQQPWLAMSPISGEFYFAGH